MPELRKDPVVGRWVIIATERGKRPSDFRTEMEDGTKEGCPFCEGSESKTPSEIFAIRNPHTHVNTPGWEVRVVPNKFPALRIEGDLGKRGVGIYDRMNGIGAHEVIIETPDHDKKMQMHSIESLAKVFEAYRVRIKDLENDLRFKYILIFKNEGFSAGASLSHPHSQLIATPVTPKRVKEELQGAQEYFEYKDRCAFCDILIEEQTQKSRVVYENEHFLSFCPFASRFPFEVMVLPKRHDPDFHTVSSNELLGFADMMRFTLAKLAKALNKPQYNFVLHTSPVRWKRRGYWTTIDQDYHWHVEIMPRLTKVAGFEWGTGFYINPTIPEEAARFLQEAEV
ncbi:MAG: galactose-1-phosphate uridylyltransferase [Chlamydiae bacterium]|nr:galactose-1-phosphate uridylyltransferase [Chlamydiota bacterium]MBI3276719.1 galactose-1-phosphate uridylyltransferase [Chlamydiota bacterium]